nr:hypothetical protein [Tanacetum cinerariifolium]
MFSVASFWMHKEAEKQKKIKPKRKHRQATKVHSPSSEIPVEESIPTPSNGPLPSAKEIANLKKRVKKLEKRRKSRPAGLRRFKKVGSSKQVESSKEKDSLGAQEDASKQERSIKDIDQDAEIDLVDEAHGRIHDVDMFGVDDLEGNEIIVDVREKIIEKEVSTPDPVTTAGEVITVGSVKDSVAPTTVTTANVDDELTLAKTLIAIKEAKPKVISTASTTVTTAITTPRAKGIVFHEQVQTHIPTVSSSKDKGKAKMIDTEKPLKKKDQIALDEEVARKQLAEQIQAQEREQLSIKEKSKLLAELIESRRKYFAAKRAKEIRNKPPTKVQQKSLMCTYMKNIDGFKQKDFKGKCFDDIKKMFDKVYKRVNTFVDMNTENVEESLMKTLAEVTKGSSKRAGQELEAEKMLRVVPEDDDDVAIKATPLSSKSPTIIDYKIYKEGKKRYFKIIRADGNSQKYLTFRTMFKNFNRVDLEVLRSIVKERFKKTKPMDDMDNLLFQTLKTMFEPHVEDIIWKYQQGAVNVNNWKFLTHVECIVFQ